MNKNLKSLILNILLPLITGGLSALISGGGFSNQSYIMPPLSPPAYLFPIVWTILYVLMGNSFYLINKKSGNEKASKLYFLQLFLNFMWPIVFFSFSSYKAAAVLLIMLIITVILMTVEFFKLERKAAYLNIPYIIWLLFALYLNIAVAVLN